LSTVSIPDVTFLKTAVSRKGGSWHTIAIASGLIVDTSALKCAGLDGHFYT
jgi:hypothetical protein